MLTGDSDPFGSGTENVALRALLQRRIHAAGPLTFRDYMAVVLHDPREGYYARRGGIGAQGDFLTSPELHPLFGALVSRQVEQLSRILNQTTTIQVVEQGAGTGKLARSLLAALPPALAATCAYTIVEPLAAQAAAQRATLGSLADRVRWTETLPHGIHCLISNELVDSFAVHRVTVQGGRMQEIYVGLDDAGGFTDVVGAPSTPALQAYFAALGLLPGEGCEAEVNLEARQWMHDAASKIEHGFVLTLDYGYPARRLYAPWRRQGTLLCFYQHTTSTDPYQRIGYQDMTTHVDFTTLARAGSEAGLRPVGFTTQRAFLASLGIEEALAGGPQALGLEEFLARRRAVATLLDSEGLGRVRVLAQATGLDSVPPLRGFAQNELEELA